MYKFIDKFGYGEPFVYIHPYKQEVVKNAVNQAFEGISHIIVFGSAVGLACKPYSDVDLCVIGDVCENSLTKLRTKGQPMDILHYTSVEELKKDRRVYEEITRKGVMVYG